jgi:hypothetical protein
MFCSFNEINDLNGLNDPNDKKWILKRKHSGGISKGTGWQ